MANIQNNIQGIYCFDSPGFNEDFLALNGYKKIKNKIFHFAAQTSIIGRLLFSDYTSSVCESTKTLFFQHNIYNWKTENDHFLKKEGFDFVSNKLDFYLKDTLKNLSYEEKKKFIDEVFNVIKDLSVDGEIAFGDSLLNFAKRFAKTLKTKSKITQDIIKSVFKHEKFEEEKIKKVTPITNKKNIEDTIGKIKDFFRVEKTDNDKVVLTIDEKYDE